MLGSGGPMADYLSSQQNMVVQTIAVTSWQGSYVAKLTGRPNDSSCILSSVQGIAG